MANRRRFQRAGPRRQTNWIGQHDLVAWETLAANGCNIHPLVMTVGTEDQATIVRNRGRIRFIALGNAGVSGIIGAGLIVVDAKAVAVGPTAIPCPLTNESDEGWLWHSYYPLRETVAALPAEENNIAGNADIEIDSKAMRKFDDS